MFTFTIAFIILCFKIMAFVFKCSIKVIGYILFGIMALIICVLSFLLNVFTVPALILICAYQKRRGGQLPHIGSWLLVFYPTFAEPAAREKKGVVRVETVVYDPLYGLVKGGLL